ncbi:hypothetical protein FO519_001664 [Halicephalobus sp. NKZ332]|nr:hypothetical protein FO519_001664 [Halicephalobus sp. NKZ332]
MSILVQTGLPLLQDLLKSTVCLNPLYDDSTKKSHGCLGYDLAEKTSPRRSNFIQRITYFDEPFSIEPWSSNGEVDSEILRAIVPRQQITSIRNQWLESEALAALQVAKRSREKGNYQKAGLIIEQAFALGSNHPDIITEYGIYMETVKKNVIEAEGLYRKALMFNPTHSEALTRRARALPLVEEIDNKMLQDIHRKREIFLSIPRWNPGLKRAMRESYFQHIWNTVALEGNTFTYGETRAILESRIAVAGRSIQEHQEIIGMEAALRFLNQTLAKVGDLQIEDILAIHKRVLGFVDPISAGMVRTTQVYVGDFTPPPPSQVMKELVEMVNWLNDEDTLRIDAVELAALTHYKLVYIHPFIDGNGRTARLLMNFILMQAGFPPVIIPLEERERYYKTLKAANEGDLRPFIRFIAKLTDDSLQSFISSSSICDPSDCPDLSNVPSPKGEKGPIIIEPSTSQEVHTSIPGAGEM